MHGQTVHAGRMCREQRGLTRKMKEAGHTAYTAWKVHSQIGVRKRQGLTAALHYGERRAPVRKGMTAVPPPTAVMTRELPRESSRVLMNDRKKNLQQASSRSQVDQGTAGLR